MQYTYTGFIFFIKKNFFFASCVVRTRDLSLTKGAHLPLSYASTERNMIAYRITNVLFDHSR